MPSDSHRPVIAEDYIEIRFPGSPALSPDGKKLVFTVKSVKDKKNTYRSPIYLKVLGEDGYRQFTSGSHVDTMPKWSPSGKLLAFLSSRPGEGKGMQLYVMAASGGEAFQMGVFPVGVIGFNWSHDDNLIHLVARVSEEELKNLVSEKKEKPPSNVLQPDEYAAYKARKKEHKKLKLDPKVIREAYCREGTSYLDGRFTQPFVIPVAMPVVGTEEPGSNKVIHIGEFGYHYTLGTFSLDNSSIYLLKWKGDPALTLEQEVIGVRITEPSEISILDTVEGWANNIQLSPDGKYLSLEARRKNESIYDDQHVLIYDLESNAKASFFSVTESHGRSTLQSRWISKDSLLFLSPSSGKSSIYRVNITMKTVTEVVGGDRNINEFSVSKDGKRIAYQVSHSTFPRDIFWCKNDGSGEERITEANLKYLNSVNVAKTDSFTFKRDGIELQAWILLPPNHDGKTRLPVVLEIHGGPATMWSPHEQTLWHEWNTLVSKGYAVIFCNPRGSDGYGMEFRSAVHKNWGEIPGGDILKALDTALERYSFLDGNRIAVTGGSYGGYMTAWLVTNHQRFKAAIAQRGVYDFIAFSTTTDIPLWFEKQYDGEVVDNIAEFWKNSPASHIKKLQTPLLIIHSENDFRVPIATAEMLFWLGKRYGKVIELVRYPRDGHELSRSGEPRHVIDRINWLVQWIQKYV